MQTATISKPRRGSTRGPSKAPPTELGCQACGWEPVLGELWPSEGATACAWIEDNCICGEGDFYGQLMKLRLDQQKFLWRWYEYCPRCNEWRHDEALRGEATGGGKALALDTPIPTPAGWTTMGQLRPGDEVFDERGDVCRVTYKSRVFEGHDCFEVVFSDGERIIADADHLWEVEERHSAGFGAPVVRSTRAIHAAGAIYDERTNRKRYRLPMPGALVLPEADLLVDPYVLGAWLGDGDTQDANFTVHIDDFPNLRAQVELAGYHVLSVAPDRRRPTTLCVRVTTQARKGTRGGTVPSLKGRLRELGVLGNKHVPVEYLRASEKQRLALLQGLMDTDGSCSPRGKCEFSTTTAELADAVCELLASLGIKYQRMEGIAKLYGRATGPKWRVQFEPSGFPAFRLERKAARLRARGTTKPLSESRQIVAINPVASVPTQCIQVDSPSHLYRAGRKMVQTHNTQFIAAVVALEFAGPPSIAPSSPDIAIAAASFEQANLLFSKVATICGGRDQVDKMSPLLGYFEVYDTEIKFADGRPGRIYRIAAVAGTNEGGLPTLFVRDELHEWGDVGDRKARVATVVGKSTNKRKTHRGRGRIISLSTAGFDKDHSLLGALYKRGLRAVRNPRVAPRLLMDWREAPDGLNFKLAKHREKAVIAASGAAGVLWNVRDRVADWGKPEYPSHEWIRYYANKWVDVAEDSWLKDHPQAWASCRGKWTSDPGNPFVVVVDMALKHDSVAVSRIEKLPDERCAIETKIFLPKGDRIDHVEVFRHIRTLAKGIGFRGVVYDPRFFEVPGRTLEDEGILVIQFDQSPQRMAPACGLAFDMIIGRKVVHDGDPDLSDHILAAAKRQQERGFTLSKGKSKKHIDAAITLCMGVWVLHAEQPKSTTVDGPLFGMSPDEREAYVRDNA